MYSEYMANGERAIRQSVTVPRRVAERVRAIARRQRTSANRVLVELIEAGLDAKDAEKRRFLELADRLTESADAGERRRLKEELARMTFGE